MSGITASGELGEKPTISFTKPFHVVNNSYEIVQKGDGDKPTDGQKLCLHQIIVNPTTGKELSSTWNSSMDCSAKLSTSTMTTAFYKLFKSMNVRSTVVLGIKSTSTSTSSTSSSSTTSYLMVLTLMQAKTIANRATGTKVTDIDSSLPTVTLASNGKPTIHGLKNYKFGGSLISQTLIEGTGAEVTSDETVSVQYTGWVLKSGKQFDTTWDDAQATDLSLSNTITGWQEGLKGKKVGSQVLLIIPADKGYGSTAKTNIPANSTLVFVIDILDAY